MHRIVQTWGVFEYMNGQAIRPMVEAVREAQLKEIQNMEAHIPELKGILAIWKEFEPAYYAMVESKAGTWAAELTAYITLTMGNGAGLSGNKAMLAYTAQQLSKRLGELKFKFR